jgi:hypothetical protein
MLDHITDLNVQMPMFGPQLKGLPTQSGCNVNRIFKITIGFQRFQPVGLMPTTGWKPILRANPV